VPNGLAPGNSGYGPALWNACEKFGLYIAVGADPAVLEMPMPFMAVAPKAAAFDTLIADVFRSGVRDSPFETELGVVEGVVDEGKAVETESTSILTGVLLEKSMPRLMGAVVSVGCAPGRIGIGWLTGSRPNRILFAL
jgi:hypothetical protein